MEPSGVKTNFEGHSKANTRPHPDYTDDMPARKLAAWVKKGIQADMGLAPSAVAETLFEVAGGGGRIPLRLPLGATCWKMAKSKYESSLAELESIKEISGMGEKI